MEKIVVDIFINKCWIFTLEFIIFDIIWLLVIEISNFRYHIGWKCLVGQWKCIMYDIKCPIFKPQRILIYHNIIFQTLYISEPIKKLGRKVKIYHFIFVRNLFLCLNSYRTKLLTNNMCNISFILYKCTLIKYFIHDFLSFWSISFVHGHFLEHMRVLISLLLPAENPLSRITLVSFWWSFIFVF